MFNKINYLVTVILLLAVVVTTGCATNAKAPLDLEALGNAVAIDDVNYVRAREEARVITINSAATAMGYAATPMITVAARNASLAVLRYLIAQKAELNVRTPDRDTALMLAALFRDEDRERGTGSTLRYDQAVRMLVDAGASLEHEDSNAYTPLAYAAYAGRESAAAYLLSKGAKPNAHARDRETAVNTPLMMAAMQGHRNTALQLLRAGADANVRVQGGMTAMEFVKKNRHTHLEQILRCAESLRPGETFRQRCE